MTPVKNDFTILLVDDRVENVISLQAILEAENRHFLCAESGEEALEYISDNTNIGLIILDVQMPGMDGFELARILKSNPQTCAISTIFVTAINKEEQYVLKGFDEGAVDYLQKPLDVNVTKAKVNVFEKLYFSQRELANALAEKDKINKQLERFTYTVAHDLKSPMSGMYSLLSLMKHDERLNDMDDINEYINILSASISNLSGRIASILDYSKQSDKEQAIEDVDTHELVKEVIQILFPPENVLIHIDGVLPVMKTKRLKLQQVFQNLISNAIKFNDKEIGEVRIGVSENNDFNEFYIKDNGPGIEKNNYELIFNLFEVAHYQPANGKRPKRESSTGVGLNVLKMLVEEQGGQIKVESEPGKGSTFYFQWKR